MQGGTNIPTDSQTLPRWPVASIDLDQTEEGPAWRPNGRGLQYSAGGRGGPLNRCGAVDPAPLQIVPHGPAASNGLDQTEESPASGGRGLMVVPVGRLGVVP